MMLVRNSLCQVCGKALVKQVGRRHPWMHATIYTSLRCNRPWPAEWKLTPDEWATKLRAKGLYTAASELANSVTRRGRAVTVMSRRGR